MIRKQIYEIIDEEREYQDSFEYHSKEKDKEHPANPQMEYTRYP